MASQTTSSSPCKKLVRSKSGMRIVPVNETERSPFELREPEWIPDQMSPTCMSCKGKFDFLHRRHHCRRCGRVCCGSCCDTRMALPRMCFLDPVRLCGPCASITIHENFFFNKHLKTLVNGAVLCLVEEVTGSGEGSTLVHCHLSPDHRHLCVSDGSPSSSPLLTLPMHRITRLEMLPTPDQALAGVVLEYCLAGGTKDERVSLEAPPDASSSARDFLLALEIAVMMVQESRAIIGTGE